MIITTLLLYLNRTSVSKNIWDPTSIVSKIFWDQFVVILEKCRNPTSVIPSIIIRDLTRTITFLF